MRKLALLSITFLASISFFSCTNTDQKEEIIDTVPNTKFVINGTIDSDADQVFLHRQMDGSLTIVDSVKLKDKAFQFSGEIEYPEHVYVTFDKKNHTGFFIENDTIQIDITNLEEKEFTVKNSATDAEYRKFTSSLSEFDDKLKVLADKYYETKENGTEEELAQIDVEYDSLNGTKNEFIKSHVNSNPNSMTTPYIIARNLLYDLDAPALKEYIDAFSDEVKKSKHAVNLQERYTTIEKLEVGKVMENFSQLSTDSVLVNLTDFEGKYVLIDFWASWCGPCRAENPNVVRAFNKYKDQGFTVLGVSLDNNRENWLSAIEKDELTWTHVSDLKGWKNEVSQSFGIMGIPASYIIGPDRTILAKNLREEDLQEFLAELFTEK